MRLIHMYWISIFVIYSPDLTKTTDSTLTAAETSDSLGEVIADHARSQTLVEKQVRYGEWTCLINCVKNCYNNYFHLRKCTKLFHG